MAMHSGPVDIRGSVALVTGANRGIGRAIARALVERGAKVYAGARNPNSVRARAPRCMTPATAHGDSS
jgi:NAD(P)-dependent dehydrogenase (short-subunit alcohol dehydrogenase family)